MSNRNTTKARKRKEQRQRRLAGRREKLRIQKGLEDRQIDRTKGSPPPKLNEEAPMPRRNDPCPLHPEHKFKRCPHGCMEMFQRMRHRVAGDTRVVRIDPEREMCPVHPEHKLAECPHGCKGKGIVGREIDGSKGAYEDFNRVLGDLGTGGLG